VFLVAFGANQVGGRPGWAFRREIGYLLTEIPPKRQTPEQTTTTKNALTSTRCRAHLVEVRRFIVLLVGTHKGINLRFSLIGSLGDSCGACRSNALRVKTLHIHQRCPVKRLGFGSTNPKGVRLKEALFLTQISVCQVVFIPNLLVVLCSLRLRCPDARRAPARRQPQRTYNAPAVPSWHV
jgi:hypothetical protein